MSNKIYYSGAEKEYFTLTGNTSPTYFEKNANLQKSYMFKKLDQNPLLISLS